MKKIIVLIVLSLLCLKPVSSQESKVSIKGELKKWHKITFSFTGDELTETGEENPFLDYRLNVTFKNKNKTYTIPGFYSADGNASETSSNKGNVWQVRFRPDAVGEWTYEVSFRKGKAIAISDNPTIGEGVHFDGLSGHFSVNQSDKKGRDFRAKGRLNYTDTGYLQFEETKEYFLKGGADSPESFLGYYEFDQTPASHKYAAHAKDWKIGDPTWKNGKGKNIIGALNYLSSKDMNSVYFLTMNVQGDGKDVWPWNDINERYRFDCSKLDQWEIVFDHMDALGLMLGEENGPLSWTPKAQDDRDRKAMAKYIKTHDPYKNIVLLHTHAHSDAQDLYLEPLLGYEYLDGPSMQTHHPHNVHDRVLKFIDASKKTEKRWIVCQDEIGPADTGAKPDVDDPEHNEIRAQVLWGNLMAGGAGVEWYFGYRYAHNDLKCEDWRSRDILWDQTKYALDFFQKYVPFTKMQSADNLTENTNDYVFADNGNTYVVYLPKVTETNINLFDFNTKFTVRWYNPRVGGKLQKGTVKTIKGGGVVSIGAPPSKDKDWVALIKNTKQLVSARAPITKKVITLNSISDFKIDKTSEAIYYIDKGNGVLAIDASNKAQRNKFANVKTRFKGESGLYKTVLNTMTENDGESVYKIKLNGKEVSVLTNPSTTSTFLNVKHELDLYLHKNDIIEVKSKAVTNGKIPENDETAWSRGRWSSLVLTPNELILDTKLKDVEPFLEKDGFVAVEAEDFHFKTNNGTKREWYIRSNSHEIPFSGDYIENHSATASKNTYIEALPDTRVTHDDELLPGKNFFPVSGTGGIVSYKVKITNPGTYYVWALAYSSGTEDNGLHVGVNGEWPESGARIQWCEGKDRWTWSSAQRVPENHCGDPQNITLKFDKVGDYVISFAMREDGFEFDKWILVKDKSYMPE